MKFKFIFVAVLPIVIIAHCSLVQRYLVQYLLSEAQAQDFSLCSKNNPPKAQSKAFSLAGQTRFKNILHNLAGDDTYAFFGFAPELIIVKSPMPNAFALPPNHIVVSTAMLEFITSNAEFAFVISHELGHIMLKHHENRLALTGSEGRYEFLLRQEIQADIYALKLLTSAGFDSKAAKSLLQRLGHATVYNASGLKDIGLSGLYPSLESRIERMKVLKDR